MSTVTSCAVTTCSFNKNDACGALGITIGGTRSCRTMTTIDARAESGGPANVGACHRIDCIHNNNLLCGADSISITADTALCASYQAA